MLFIYAVFMPPEWNSGTTCFVLFVYETVTLDLWLYNSVEKK